MIDFEELAVEDVSRHFGRRKALSKITFTARAGSILGLLGPNGAGKSTLLAILGTLLLPTSGRVRYGTHADASADLRARIGMLGHDLYLYPELTAGENLAFFAALYGDADPGGAADRALARASLAERANDPVASFSRGMRQRVALERALIHGPRLLLLDEPFTGLDEASVAALLARLRDLKTQGAIVVLATHDLDVADGLITRMAVVRNGRLLSEGVAGVAIRQQYRALMEQA